MAKKIGQISGGTVNLGKPSPGAMTAADFAKLGGEVFAGKRILKLKENEGAGPFIVVEILKDQDLNGKSKKKLAPVTVYVATDADGQRINMPVAAAFLAKADEAKLAVGDEFSVFRTENYTSKTYKTQGFGYMLTITRRAGKK